MTIDELKALMASGNFHHATMRTDFARGLHIYAKEPENKFNGFKPVGYFSSVYEKELCDEAYEMTRKTGISMNAYGSVIKASTPEAMRNEIVKWLNQ